MVTIDWKEFKEFKQHSSSNDNFKILLDFMRSYYNLMDPRGLYESFSNDPTAQMMLEKRNITDAEGLENFLFKF